MMTFCLGFPSLLPWALAGKTEEEESGEGGRVERKGQLRIPAPPPASSSSRGLSLQAPEPPLLPSHTAVHRGPGRPPTSICRKTSRPSVISPNTTCLPSSQSVLSHVRKNWEPLVFGPELAMESRPGGENDHMDPLHPAPGPQDCLVVEGGV